MEVVPHSGQVVWRHISERYWLLRKICKNGGLVADTFDQIFGSLYILLTHRHFSIYASKPSEMLAVANIENCLLDCCVETDEEFVKQVCRVLNWSTKNADSAQSVQRFLRLPYENRIALLIEL
jgi:hypothetical protein